MRAPTSIVNLQCPVTRIGSIVFHVKILVLKSVCALLAALCSICGGFEYQSPYSSLLSSELMPTSSFPGSACPSFTQHHHNCHFRPSTSLVYIHIRLMVQFRES